MYKPIEPGDVFGRLEVLKVWKARTSANRVVRVRCLDCGSEGGCLYDSRLRRHTPKCVRGGLCHTEKRPGAVFGNVKIIERVRISRNTVFRVRCLRCGKEGNVRGLTRDRKCAVAVGGCATRCPDRIGDRYGHLVVVEVLPLRSGEKNRRLRVRCAVCRAVGTPYAHALRAGSNGHAHTRMKTLCTRRIWSRPRKGKAA
jgi:ribosomal protein S27E